MESNKKKSKIVAKTIFQNGVYKKVYKLQQKQTRNDSSDPRFDSEVINKTKKKTAGKKTTEKESAENPTWFVDWLNGAENQNVPKLEKLSPDGPDNSVKGKKTIIAKEDMRRFLMRRPVTTVDIVREFAPKVRKIVKISDNALLLDMWIVIKQVNPFVQTIAKKKYYSLEKEPETSK